MSWAKARTHTYVLSNSLKLIVREDHRSPSVMCQIWYRAGASYEPSGHSGVAHLLEHMMFRGSRHYPNHQFSSVIAANGGLNNAMTDYDYTMYFEQLHQRKLELCFQLEADRMANALLEKTYFGQEKEVVMEERRLRVDNQPQALTFERFMAAAYIANPYHHPVIGWMHDIKNLTLDDVRQFYHKWYVPNNTIMVVVGDVNPKQTYHLARHYFGRLSTRPLPVIKTPQALPALGIRSLVVHQATNLPWFVMGYQVPSLMTSKAPTDVYALMVLHAVLDGYRSARLPQRLVKMQCVASSVSSHYQPLSRYNSLFLLEGRPSQSHHLSELMQAVKQQIKQLQRTLITPQELRRVKQQVIADHMYRRDSIYAQAYEIGLLETLGLSWQVGERLVSSIRAVTAEQVRRVARRYLNDRNLTVATLHPGHSVSIDLVGGHV